MRKPSPSDMDEIDLKIIEELKNNCKISYKNLGEKVQMSTPTVYERTKKLEERGIIQGYQASINYAQLGYTIHALILVKVDNYTIGIPKFLDKIKEVHNFWIVSGEFSYVVEVYTQDIDELNALVDRLYHRIGRTTLMLILDGTKKSSLL